MDIRAGCEWIVDAHGCDPETLRDPSRLQSLFAALVKELALHPVKPTDWYQFPDAGGITGLCLLAESHIACHTFPEYGTLCLNLFCCRPRPEWDFARRFKEEFGARSVRVRRIERSYVDDEREELELPELRRPDSLPLV